MRESESEVSFATESFISNSKNGGRPPRAPGGMTKNRSSMGLMQAGRRIAHKTSRHNMSDDVDSPFQRAAYTGARQRSALMNKDGYPLTTAEFIRAKDQVLRGEPVSIANFGLNESSLQVW